jgi:hypothetical protein
MISSAYPDVFSIFSAFFLGFMNNDYFSLYKRIISKI